MTAVAERKKETNDEGYYEVDATKFRPMGNRILVKWEFHLDEIKAGKITLLRPETLTKQKYTGVVLAMGPMVQDQYEDIEVGARLLFDQFSGFEKFFDQKHGRMALIDPDRQGSAFAIIPLRAKIGEGEGDYNYNV